MPFTLMSSLTTSAEREGPKTPPGACAPSWSPRSGDAKYPPEPYRPRIFHPFVDTLGRSAGVISIYLP